MRRLCALAIVSGLSVTAWADDVPAMSYPADAGLTLEHVDDPYVPGVARELFADLACTCGECEHLPLASCPCGFAGERRQEIVTMLRGKDLSTPDKQRAAYDQIRADFVSRYGGDVIVANTSGTHVDAAALGVYVVTAAGVLVLGVLSWHWQRKKKRTPSATKARIQKSRSAASTARRR